MEEVGHNRVRVSGASGAAPPPTLKACAQVPDGWRAQLVLFVGGRDAVAKARRVGTDLLERGRQMLASGAYEDFRSTDVEVLGAEDTYGGSARRGDTREVVLKIGAHHDSREALARFIREVPSIALAGPPGVSGGGTGLPRPSPLIRLECFAVDRALSPARVTIDGEPVAFDDVPVEMCADPPIPTPVETPVPPESGPTVDLPLVVIAHGRSGDKGADVNIGIRARHRDLWPLLADTVTADRVAVYLEHLGAAAVERYVLPGIRAVNLVLRGGLGSGGTASLRFDPQGKAVAQQLLDMSVPLPVALLEHPELRETPELIVARQTFL